MLLCVSCSPPLREVFLASPCFSLVHGGNLATPLHRIVHGGKITPEPLEHRAVETELITLATCRLGFCAKYTSPEVGDQAGSSPGPDDQLAGRRTKPAMHNLQVLYGRSTSHMEEVVANATVAA